MPHRIYDANDLMERWLDDFEWAIERDKRFEAEAKRVAALPIPRRFAIAASALLRRWYRRVLFNEF